MRRAKARCQRKHRPRRNFPPPAAATGLAVLAITNTQVLVSWSDNSDNEANFVVQRATNSSFTAGVVTLTRPKDLTTYNWGGLYAGHTYYFRVQAKNAGGASAYSNVVSATTANGTGLAGTFCDNIDFTGKTTLRKTPTVNFNWGTGIPASGIASETFTPAGWARFKQSNRATTPSRPTATRVFDFGLTANL